MSRFTSGKCPQVFRAQVVADTIIEVGKKMETPAPAGNRNPFVQSLSSNYAIHLYWLFICISTEISKSLFFG